MINNYKLACATSFTFRAPAYSIKYHLICDTGLKYIDACLSSSTFFSPGENDLKKYFASLAAISNTWREKAAQIISEWEKTFGPSKQGRQFPQHVLQGRWGSVDNAEKFYLSRGREQIQSVLLKVISKHIKADKSGKDKDKGKDKDSNQVLDGDKGTVALADLDETKHVPDQIEQMVCHKPFRH